MNSVFNEMKDCQLVFFCRISWTFKTKIWVCLGVPAESNDNTTALAMCRLVHVQQNLGLWGFGLTR